MDPTTQQWRFQQGDEVVGTDDAKLGKVAEVLPAGSRPAYLRVEQGRLFHHDYYVPVSAVSNYDGGTVYLNVTKDEALRRGWDAVPAAASGAVGAPPTSPPGWGSAATPPSPPPIASPSAPSPASPPATGGLGDLATSAGGRQSMRAEPTVNDLSPILQPGVENEPMLLLDTTGSMSYAAAEGSPVQRRQVLGEAIGRIVEKLAAQDAQAAKEQAAGEDAGGLMTVTFADGAATNIGDLSPDNWRRKWAEIRWGGGTQIMPGWNLLVDTYMEEFGDVPKLERPHLLGLVVTDGEADDTDRFAQELAQTKGGTYVCVAVLGYGQEHDRALAAYRQIAATNDHVRVVTFGSETDPDTIADGLLSLLG